MIQMDEGLKTAQENVRKLEQFLLAARQSHPPDDYRRMAEPFLLELQQRQAEVVAYLAGTAMQEAA